MSTVLNTVQDAQNYANKLTLDIEGLPPLTEDPGVMGQLMKHQVQVGRDVFTLDRFLQWTDKRTRSQVQAATARNPFGSSGPCPITEDEFIKYAPEKITCIFLNQKEVALLAKAFPTGIGQVLNSKKKAGEKGTVNPKTGKTSGGRYNSGAFGYWLGGKVSLPIEVPGKGEVYVTGRPTINMALEGTKRTDGSTGAAEGHGEEEEGEE